MFHPGHFHTFRTDTNHRQKRRTLLQWKYRHFSQLNKRTDVNKNSFDFMSFRVELQTRREWQCGVSWMKFKMVYPMLLSTFPPHTLYNWPSSLNLYVMHNEPNQTGPAVAPLRTGADDSTNDFSPNRRRRHLRPEYNTELRTWDRETCLQLLVRARQPTAKLMKVRCPQDGALHRGWGGLCKRPIPPAERMSLASDVILSGARRTAW